MRKRVSEIIAAALAVAGLLGDGPTAQAQESGGDQQAGADGGGEGPDCAAHPFDIMAIQVLY